MRQRLRFDWTKALLATSIATAAAATGMGTAQAAPTGPTQTVSYLGRTFQVPSSWPVVNLADQPSTCVRFDQHTVYLGTPGAKQSCPAHLSGRTEALLIEPQSDPNTVTTDNPSARELVAYAPNIKVTATYANNRTQVRDILLQAGLAQVTSGPAHNRTTTTASTTAAAAVTPAVFRTSTASVTSAAAVNLAAATVPSSTTDYTGYGFDACSAPASSDMNAWMSSSPYRAIGVYIGGARACAQPNLTSGWLQQQASAGWHFMPIYVGTQASGITNAGQQGALAADDAANQAAALGLGPGSTLYDDMEQYSSTYSTAVLSYLSSWTTELHARGYHSGVYSSSSSGVSDLVKNATNYTLPDVIWDAWWNGQANTTDPVIPASDWANHQRVHQYDGDVTESYGGVTINIDHDYLDVSVSGNPVYANNRDVAVVENGALHDVYPAADGWHDDVVPNVGTGLSAVAEAYYNGSRTEAAAEGSALHDIHLAADGWHDDVIPTAGGSVTAVSTTYSPSGIRVIEAVEGGNLHEIYLDASGWHDNQIPNVGGNVGAVSVTYNSSGMRVIEATEGGNLHEIYVDSSANWHDNQIPNVGGNVTSVGFAIDPNGYRVIEAVEGGNLHEIYVDSSANWHDNAIPNTGPATTVSMARRSDGTRVLEAAEGGNLHEIYVDSSANWHDNAVPNAGGGVTSTSIAYH